MFIKRLKTIGGLSSLSRYVNMLAGLASYLPTTNSTAIIIPANVSPYWQIQGWSNGFTGKYADPSSNITYYLTGSSFSRGKGYVGATYRFSPYIGIWPFSDIAGFGTRYGSPNTPPDGPANDIQLDMDNGYVFVAHDISPYISVYNFTTSAGFGSKIANPSSLSTSTGRNVQYSNETVFLGTASSPFINAYTFNGTFGTKYSNPATLPTYGGDSLAIHPSGSAAGTGGISGLYLYAWDKYSGFGTKYAQPSSNPYAGTVKFSSTGNTVALASQGSSPYIHAYPFTIASGFGTKYSNPATLPPGSNQYYNNLAFSYGAAAVATGTNTTPYINAYAFSEGTGFGSKYADPTTAYASGSFTGGINFN